MVVVDWIIIISYMAAMIGFGFYLGRGQDNIESYFVGSRNFKWWMVGISTMATQTSAISFISIPAFVALKDNGGLSWLQYELAVPLAMIVTMIFLIPFFRELKLVSIYEYLDRRFGPSVKTIVSITFLVSRGLGTGVALYAAAIVLSVCADLPLAITIIIIGIATIIYDVAGGIRAVIYSDVIQMGVLVIGIFVCVIYAVDLAGGMDNVLTAMPEERMRAIVPSTGFGDETQVPFWAFLIGGFFLYLSYYGTDQSQVQRGLSAKTSDEVKKSLVLNGLLRFPLTLLYVALGISLYAAFHSSAELQAVVPADKPDYLVPYFIVHELPVGLRGVLFAALLSATMSSLDSALNSLSAVTVRDFVEPRLRDKSQVLTVSKGITVIWGVLITGFAFIVGDISDTVIEGINKIGSAFYGPILATFILGILVKRVHANAVITGLVVGVATNLVLWLFAPSVHWMWWNVFGFSTSVVVAMVVSWVIPTTQCASQVGDLTLSPNEIVDREWRWIPVYGGLVLYFIFIITFLMFLN